MREYKRIEWTMSKIILAAVLILSSIACILLGLKPFFEGDFDKKNFANIGFMLLILILIGAVFKLKKTSRYVFWSGCFALVLYTNLMFLFYEDLFF